MRLTHIVVDTAHGSPFWTDANGQRFDETSARAFASEANAAMRPGHRTYEVFQLVPMAAAAGVLADVLEAAYPGDSLPLAIEILEARWAAESRAMDDGDDEHFTARKLADEMNAPTEIPGLD
jgi:hypothetical protein